MASYSIKGKVTVELELDFLVQSASSADSALSTTLGFIFEKTETPITLVESNCEISRIEDID